MREFDKNRFFFSLYGKIEKPPRPKRTWSLADYVAMGMVLPHSLLCGAMAVAGMILLSGIPWLAIAAGICSFAIIYLRFGQYAPQLFRKIPFTLFKEIDEKGLRNNRFIQERDRLGLILFFIFILTPLSALIITFFSLSLMKNAFEFLGIAGGMTLGGLSIIPAFTVFGLACFLCTWSMFSDGASNMFARNDFWDHLFYSTKQLLCIEPDPTLLLHGENQASLGRWLLVRQVTRLILVFIALTLICYGNYIVGLSGVDFMINTLKISSIPWEVSELVLPALMLIGSAAFIVGATKHLITLFILSTKFMANQLVLPIIVTLHKTKEYSLSTQGACLCAAVLLAPMILVIRALISIALTEYYHLSDSIVSPYNPDPAHKSMFHDTATVFDHLRCNTNISFVNISINTLIIIPLTFVLGIGIFLSQHVKLFATINAINTGAMAYNTELPLVNNYLSMTGYLVSSLNFGYRTIEPCFNTDKQDLSSNMSTLLFKFSHKSTTQQADHLDKKSYDSDEKCAVQTMQNQSLKHEKHSSLLVFD